MPGNWPGSTDTDKFFKDFNDKVQSDWNQMCEQSKRDWQDWARRNNVQNFPDTFPMNNAFNNFPEMQSNWSALPLRQDNAGCGRLIGDVRNDDNGLALALDVSLFKPEELKVTTIGNELVIEAKHDENRATPNNSSSEHRQFSQKYTLPEGCVPESVTSQLSHDGVLTVTAPRRAIQYSSSPRPVPIQGASTAPRLVVSNYH
uniref:SHSP domain-containing protein n=1 Tax=Plectus sambesii TaxID=2011161 RepID=A0A914W8V2_9BILA